jgi:predicted transcriptional regulator
MLEDEVLAALWRGGRPMSPAEVQAALGGVLAYTTVMTTLARLHRKSMATRTREGRGYVYFPGIDEASHTTAAATNALLRRRQDHGRTAMGRAAFGRRRHLRTCTIWVVAQSRDMGAVD